MAPTTVVEALDFALRLEHLEAGLYAIALGQTPLPSGYAGPLRVLTASGAPPQAVIAELAKHEAAHVALLQSLITARGGTASAAPNADFTGGGGSFAGPFASVFTDPATFLVVAQGLEDLGVRAWGGLAPLLATEPSLLRTAHQLRAIEGRHASRVRRARGEKGWIGATVTLPAPLAAVYGAGQPAASYPAESSPSQLGVTVSSLPGGTASAAVESFDEPLDPTTVAAIVAAFVAP